MTITREDPVDVLIVAVPETAGSALYGMLDVLLAAGNIWQTLVRSPVATAFRSCPTARSQTIPEPTS